MSEEEAPLIVVVGPTASGKSTLAARLAWLVGGEVVSADSVQVYRHFDVGAGKPTLEERALAPHHLIDCADANEPLEASVWARWADAVIAEIRARGNVPIVCGGTFLWVRALLYGLADAPSGDASVRERHRELSERHGRIHLHALLAAVDPASAERLHPNDFIRVSRALEVFELSGRRMSDVQHEHGFRERRYRATLLRVEIPIEQYEERLAKRVHAMLAAGFRDEVRELVARGYGGARAMEAVGYKQVRAALGADTPQSDDELALEIIRVTRIFARRQRTWLRDETLFNVPQEALSNEAALAELAAGLGLSVRQGSGSPAE